MRVGVTWVDRVRCGLFGHDPVRTEDGWFCGRCLVGMRRCEERPKRFGKTGKIFFVEEDEVEDYR